MSVLELFLVAIGLSADAFAVSLCKGLAMPALRLPAALSCGIWFGSFQGLMPLLGYFLGIQFQQQIAAIDHWIAFALLSIIGITMIKESRTNDQSEANADTSFPTMFLLAVATSIDAMAIGMTFGVLQVNIIFASALIAVSTAILSPLGVVIGHRFGSRLQGKAELCGGLILIFIGTKILMEHLGKFPF